MPKVTVALSTYNRANTGYLELALQSVLKQDYQDIEIVVYNNGSTDNTDDIVAQFSDPKLNYVRLDKNTLGIFNIIMERCCTEYLVVFHDDDVMLPNMITTEVEVLDSHPQAILCGQISSSAIIIDEVGKETFRGKHPSNPVVFARNEYIKHSIKHGNVIFHPSVMYRVAKMRALNLNLNPTHPLTCDWRLWLEANSKHCEIIGINQPIIKYRVHSKSGTYMLSIDAWCDALACVEDWYLKNGFHDIDKLKQYFVLTLSRLFGAQAGNGNVKLRDIFKLLSDIEQKYGWHALPKTKLNAVMRFLKYYLKTKRSIGG